ncbi:MAG: hypothetical protein M1814_002444 [Vezdaea aestivalis]|nr:MAG: hypothetical protein M1814_002444 [Vezdaea aestivalis]
MMPRRNLAFAVSALALLYLEKITYQLAIEENQVTPFWIETEDSHSLHAWHILPVGLYGKHEDALIEEKPNIAMTVEDTLGFHLLTTDPKARLVINFHGNAGTLVQGWRTDTYRALSAADPNKIHVLAFDYRGFGKSKGTPNEDGLIADATAVVDWALNVAKIPSERILVIGQSLGTGVVSAVAEHFIDQSPKVEFGGIILVAAFSDIPNLLRTYAIGGVLPILSPLKPYPALQLWFGKRFRDTWDSAARIRKVAAKSDRLRLTLVHAKNDRDINCEHSDVVFQAAVQGTDEDLTPEDIEKQKTVVDLGKEGKLYTWRDEERIDIRAYFTTHGGHNRITTYSWVPIAIRRSLNL